MKKADHSPALSGAMTALVTPFRVGEIDWPALSTLIERQIDGGIDWLVPCGTTGETPTLSAKERERVLETVRSLAVGRCRVMAGTGSNCTSTSIEMTKAAAGAGADAALIVTPYYNRPTQEGLFRHFAAIAEQVQIPIVLYNVPARTAVNMSNDTVVRLRERFPHVAGLKDATGNVDGVTDLVQRCDINVLCGDDALTWPMMAVGAVGVISVLSNLCPALMKSVVVAALRGDARQAMSYHRRIHAVATALGRFGPNPVPIKTAMAAAGMIAEEFRLPLCPLEVDARREIERLLRRHELLLEPAPVS